MSATPASSASSPYFLCQILLHSYVIVVPRVLFIFGAACWYRDDLAVMEKAKATKAAKLNATRNACKKRSKGIVSELAAAEKQLARPRAVRLCAVLHALDVGLFETAIVQPI